jgi:hypothetical protein
LPRNISIQTPFPYDGLKNRFFQITLLGAKIISKCKNTICFFYQIFHFQIKKCCFILLQK